MRCCDEGDVTNEVKEEIKSELTQEEQNSTNKLKPKRPQLNYDLLGIPRGAVLTYTKDASIHVTIDNDYTQSEFSHGQNMDANNTVPRLL